MHQINENIEIRDLNAPKIFMKKLFQLIMILQLIIYNLFLLK